MALESQARSSPLRFWEADRPVLVTRGERPAIGGEHEHRDPLAPTVGQHDQVPARLVHEVTPGESQAAFLQRLARRLPFRLDRAQYFLRSLQLASAQGLAG